MALGKRLVLNRLSVASLVLPESQARLRRVLGWLCLGLYDYLYGSVALRRPKSGGAKG